MLNAKDLLIPLIAGLIKQRIVLISNLELVLSNCATKADL